MRKKHYLVLDTETATLPFANDIAKNESQKKSIAIAKPIVYDIGWVIQDRKGNIEKEANYLVQETFFVPQVFNTAYYKDKRPLYIKMLDEKKIVAKNWDEIINELYRDLCYVDIGTAYNACFDFKKAIPFTEKYIKHLYSADFQQWEDEQRKKCIKIAKSGKSTDKNPDYLKPHLKLRGEEFPIADLWGIACKNLIMTQGYKKYCLDNKLVTNSVKYFKTSAETTFQYLLKKYDFVEEHTALSDAKIEAAILVKALQKKKVEPGIEPFPFRLLGTTFDWILEKPSRKKYVPMILELLSEYISSNDGWAEAEILNNSYWSSMVGMYQTLDSLTTI